MEYKVQAVKEIGDPDQYGNKAFSVLFEGGESVFMKAQKEPVVGEVEFGIISEEAKKSGDGTYKRFRRKKREGSVQGKQHNEEGMYWCNAVTNATTLIGVGGAPEQVIDFAKQLYEARPGNQPEQSGYEKAKAMWGSKKEEPKQEPKEEKDDIDLDNIEF